MRLYNTPFFLVKIDIENLYGSSDTYDLSMYDADFVKLPLVRQTQNHLDKIELNIQLPNKLIIEVVQPPGMDNHQLGIKKFNLAGIDVDKDHLLRCSEYRLCGSNNSVESMSDIMALETTKTLTWTGSGYLIIDLFHPNPFAWHLYIGNKIKIYQD